MDSFAHPLQPTLSSYCNWLRWSFLPSKTSWKTEAAEKTVLKALAGLKGGFDVKIENTFFLLPEGLLMRLDCSGVCIGEISHRDVCLHWNIMELDSAWLENTVKRGNVRFLSGQWAYGNLVFFFWSYSTSTEHSHYFIPSSLLLFHNGHLCCETNHHSRGKSRPLVQEASYRCCGASLWSLFNNELLNSL